MIKKAMVVFFLSLCSYNYALDISINDNAGIVFPYLESEVGSRAIAMGGAYSAVVGDSTAMYWNPAGLGHVKYIHASMEYRKWFADSSFQHITAAMPLEFGSAGIKFSYASMGYFDILTEDGFLTGEGYSPFSLDVKGGYGVRVLDTFLIGATAGVVFQSVSAANELSILLDFGLLYEPVKEFSAALVFQNLGMGSDHKLPSNIKAAAAWLPLNEKDHKVTFSADLSYQVVTGMIAAVGAEYRIFEIASVRAGYNFSPGQSSLNGLTGIRAGAGFKAGLFDIDYALSFSGDFGLTHAVTLGFDYVTQSEAIKEMTTDDFEKILAKRYFTDAQIYFNMGNYDEALAQIKKARALAPADKAVYKWQQYIIKFSSRRDDQISAIEKERNKAFEEANKYYSENDYSAALQAILAIGENDDNYKRAQSLAGVIQTKMSEADERLVKANGFIKDKKYLSAASELRAALSICPGCNDPKQRYVEIKPELEKIAKEYYLAGVEKYTKNELDSAIRDWERAITAAPDSEYAVKSSGNIKRAKTKLKQIEKLE